MRVPLNTPDFASYVLQAQNSGAQVLGLANAGPDFSNALKAANELGITKTMKPPPFFAAITDIRALGLETAQGLYLTTRWYWDLDNESHAFAQAVSSKVGREPTFIQAVHYSATITYLSAVKAAGSTDPDKVMDELRKMKINDMFTEDGTIRADEVMEHSMYVMQVKRPSKSKYPWDSARVVQKISGEQALGKLADSTCALVKKWH